MMFAAGNNGAGLLMLALWLVLDLDLIWSFRPHYYLGAVSSSRGGKKLFERTDPDHAHHHHHHHLGDESHGDEKTHRGESRRSVLGKAVTSGAAWTSGLPIILSPSGLVPSTTTTAAVAAVGSLPELENTNVVLQGITVKVADESQQDAMIKFLVDGLECKVLRQSEEGNIMKTWMGFGPEEHSIPKDFVFPVSSFSKYGGHATICVSYDSTTRDVYYQAGNNANAPGNNIAYLQVGVPSYRISQMVKNKANVVDAYGYVSVVSPCGLPIRAIVGISPDPMMLVAITCENIETSRTFYNQLGFVEQEYPYCRPNNGKGQFEPEQPKNSVYLAPSPNSMGILLIPADKRGGGKVKPNNVVESLNLVYTPSSDGEADAGIMSISDPSQVGISLLSEKAFERIEKSTRVAVPPAKA